MGTVKTPRGKLPFSVITIGLCTLAFFGLLYTERISFFSSSNIFKLSPCSSRSKKIGKGNVILLIIYSRLKIR